MNWPGSAAFAFTLSIDVDGDLPLLAEGAHNLERAKTRSAGQYGPEHGAWRLLRLLEELELSAHWFLPGQIATKYPELVSMLLRSGQHIGVHGHAHLDFDRLDVDEQIAEMLAGKNALEQVTGAPVSGFRTPAGEWAPGFLQAMQEAGLQFSSSLPSDEVPFHLAETELVEIPFRYELEDMQYLGYSLDPPFPPGQSRITPLEIVEENWGYELEGAKRYGTLAHLRLNAEVMGIASRTRMLRRFLTHVTAQENVWLAGLDELYALTRNQTPDERHPHAIFTRLTAPNA